MPLTKVSAGIIAANAINEGISSQSITGDKLGLTAINANNIVGASITGDKLVDSITIANTTTSNIANFLGPIFEKANVVTTGGLTANVTINVVSSGVLVYTTNSSSNAAINFTGLSAMTVGNVASYVVMVPNGATARYIQYVQIDGTSVTPKWSGGTPSTGTSANTDIYSFNIVKTSAAPTYNVFAQVSSFF
jgi:hypothetical protein